MFPLKWYYHHYGKSDNLPQKFKDFSILKIESWELGVCFKTLLKPYNLRIFSWNFDFCFYFRFFFWKIQNRPKIGKIFTLPPKKMKLKKEQIAWYHRYCRILCKNRSSLKGPIHDSDLQPQPQFPQPPPQLAGRGCGCCWSEFSDIWWAELKVAVEVAVVYGQKRSNMSHKRRYLNAFELVHWYKWNFPGQTGSEIIYHSIWLLIIKVTN